MGPDVIDVIAPGALCWRHNAGKTGDARQAFGRGNAAADMTIGICQLGAPDRGAKLCQPQMIRSGVMSEIASIRPNFRHGCGSTRRSASCESLSLQFRLRRVNVLCIVQAKYADMSDRSGIPAVLGRKRPLRIVLYQINTVSVGKCSQLR